MRSARLPRSRAMVALALVVSLVAASCSRSGSGAKAARPGDTVRHRLPLRNNPVSSAEATRCYGRCQVASTPGQYLECLSECPGFERTDGEYCSATDVPPVAACLTVRRIPASTEPPPGYVVLATVGAFALIVATASLCAASSTRCGTITAPY